MSLLDELREANPVRDVEMPSELATRVLSRRRRRRSRRWLLVPVAALACACALLFLPRGAAPPSLAARAYAATAGTGILHWRSDLAVQYKGHVGSRQRTEGWRLGSVEHIVHSDVVHGKAIVTVETRSWGKRTRVWSKGSDRWHSSPRVKPAPGPFSGGDPFAAFRQAYRAGTLRDLGGGRFEVPFKHMPAGTVVYDVDQATGRPLRLTVLSGKATTVVTFSVYERLEATPENRKLLAALPHPGPGTQPASRYFAVLRSGSAPTDLPPLPVKEFSLDLAAARAVGKNLWLIPGKGSICLAMKLGQGSGVGCRPLRLARKRGIASGNMTDLWLVVPDGVKSVRAHEWGSGQADKTYPVSETGLAHLPGIRYGYRLSRR